MATARIAYRRSAVGISAGLGIALPLAAYAATLPFEGINDAVQMDAMPFAAGIVAGVGMLTLTGHLLDRHAERLAAEEAEAAQFTSIFSDSDVVVPRTARDHADAPVRGKRFAGSAANDVPVISRAANAMSEMEAWAEIDAMFSEDSPISCDPTRSKDVYQIAFEELRRADSAPAPAADSTAMFMSLAGVAAPAAQPQAQDVAKASMSDDDLSDASDRNAAMEALYGSTAHQPAVPVMKAPQNPLYGVSGTQQAPQAQPAVEDSTPLVPMADYSGHEDMWASALAILGEEPVPAVTRTERQPSETSFVPRDRMAAVAEGGAATQQHSRVNSLIGEEFDKAPSSSARHTSHEYLKVIEGGTASMRPLKVAEA